MQTHFLLASGLLIMALSLSGLIFVKTSLAGWLARNLKYLVSLSAGVFLITSLNLVRESVELARHADAGSLAFIAVASGFLAFLMSQKLWPESHHHHEEDCDHGHNRRGVMRMLIGDGIHNIGDGIILAAAFMTNTHTGLVVALGIVIHEFLQEISEFFVLRNLGLSVRQALARNVLVSSTLLIGIAIGLFIAGNAGIQAAILGLAGGGFLYIVFHDLVPYREYRKPDFWKHVAFFTIGLVLVLSVNYLDPHDHEEGRVDEIA